MKNPINRPPIQSSDRWKIEVDVASDVTTHTNSVWVVTLQVKSTSFFYSDRMIVSMCGLWGSFLFLSSF